MIHRFCTLGCLTVCLTLSFISAAVQAADWKPAAGPLATRWAKDVSPKTVHSEYPRPQMVRSKWLNLNGLWDYSIQKRATERPKSFDGSILVPFPVESALSGVMKRVGPDQQLWYRRTFDVPAAWKSQRLLLHFDAVDWETIVWIDGKQIGMHRGGYAPFTFDITDEAPAGQPHELVVSVWDPSDAGPQPRGKQVNKPNGIWYTPSTGIWQTVWLEPVGKSHLDEIYFQAGGAPNAVLMTNTVATAATQTEGPKLRLAVDVFDQPADGSTQRYKITSVSNAADIPLSVTVPPDNVRLWTPDDPHLYGATVKLLSSDGKQVLDEVETYFALRTVYVDVGPSKQKETARICLNGHPVFLIGPLDQGFWPDGLYTAPTDEALRSDLETTKRLGFNLVRKHVKVEPARWYYWCDRLGLLVFQEMPSGDKSAPEAPKKPPEITRTPDSATEFESELAALISSRRSFPSIIAWVPFNEGWGQYNTEDIAASIKKQDRTRLVIPASGWNDFPVGDIHDIHRYPGPGAPPANPQRAVVLGEFGGLGLPIPEHLWMKGDKNWGYRRYKTSDDLTAAYLELTNKLAPLVESRLSAAVYTQTTDVETEVNGLMTYDRALIKMDADKIRQANLNLIQIPARFTP